MMIGRLKPLTCLCALALTCLSLAAGAASACEGRLVESEYLAGGSVCVPLKVERIVVLDPTFSLGMSIELGLPVVGAPLFGMSDEHLLAEAKARSVEDLGAFTEPSIEKVIGLKPDLIIGSGMLGEGALALASRIAPTALIEVPDWKAYYRTLADLTGKREEADKALAAFERRVASIRQRVPDITVSVLRITSWDFQVYLDGPGAYAPMAILQEAGVKRTAYETGDGTVGPKRPDWESLAALDGDVLLYIIGGANNSDTNGRHEEVLSNPLWKMLPAVASGNVHRVDAATWMEFSGLASANRVLDDVERYIIARP